jgi:hypothetical protein
MDDEPLLLVLRDNISRDLAERAILKQQQGYTSGGTRIAPAQINSVSCHLSNKAQNRVGGYVKLKLTSGGTEYYLHHLALIAVGRGEEMRTNGHQVSHLCHNCNCFNAEHLIVESGEANRDRNKCQGWTWIKCPHGELFNPCHQHTPKCILPRQ